MPATPTYTPQNPTGILRADPRDPRRFMNPHPGIWDEPATVPGYWHLFPNGDGAHPTTIVHCSLYIVHCPSYTFSAKERDPETGLSYLGSRYYSSDLSIWLSVDPMAHKYPSLSPYVYCANNPVKLVDPNGEEFSNPDDPPKNKSQNNSKSSTTTTAGTSQTYNGLFFNASYSTSQTKGDQKLLNVDKKTSTELKTGETTSTTSYQFGKPKLNASAEVGVSTSGSTTGKLNTTVGGVQAGVGFTTTQKIDNSQVSVSLGYSNGEKSSSVAVSIKPLRVAAVVATVFIAAASTAIIHVPIVIPF